MNKKAELLGKRIGITIILALMLILTIQFSHSEISCEPGTTSTDCQPYGTRVLRMQNTTNAHLELPNQTLYDYGVCCIDTGPGNITINTSNMYGSWNFLDISSQTNAHAEYYPNETGGNYTNNLYIGAEYSNITCGLVNTTVNCTSAGYDTCVARLNSGTNAHAELCDQTNYSEQVCCDMRYTVGAGWSNITLPEGIYTIKPATPPGYGTYHYEFNITFKNLTASDGDVIGCNIKESNCYDTGLGGCTQIFVNKTIARGAFRQDYTINWTLQPTDSINTTEAGTSTHWIPWEIINCTLSNNWEGIYFNNTITWRVHVHGTTWETGDIARANNCYNGLSNEYFKNNIRCDALGDVTFASSMYSGTKVESECHNTIDDDDPDFSADCSDTDCWGITHSCTPKQDLQNTSLYYSPSGSHGTLAANITTGDIESTTSSAETQNTKIEWTQHTNPSGTFKIRFARWALNKVATITVEGLPEIKEVNKYAAGTNESTGLIEYFKANIPSEPSLKTNKLEQTGNKTYQNKFVIKSFSASQQITNLDTTINVTFLHPELINLTEGYNVQITLAYCQGATCDNDYITIPVYFDNTSFISMNENESDIWMPIVNWSACNDTKNADFDYLGTNLQNSFEQQSYDCYDIDCDGMMGTPAWNAYLGINTSGNCEYTSEQTCYDGYNNDWATEAANLGHLNTDATQMLPDCRDTDCNGKQGDSLDTTKLCNYNRELNCSDTFDNDQYQSYDCVADANKTLGSYDYWEYDCQNYCRDNAIAPNQELGDQCYNGIDDDMDKYVFTVSNATNEQTAIDNTYGTGIDCQYYNATITSADEDCNLSINSINGFRCELGIELRCTDGFDNDMDATNATGWSGNYDGYVTYNIGADCSDYDCYHRIDPNGNFFNSEEGEFYACPLKEYSPDGSNGYYQGNVSWCFDNVDNDLDGLKDCQETECLFAVNPANPDQICYPQEFNLTLEYQVCNNYFTGQPWDDNQDGKANCQDSTCKQAFGYCGPCPTYENITWQSCADGTDNDLDNLFDCADPDCNGELGDYDGRICQLTTETTCDDGFDNDADGLVDCKDPNCDTSGICQLTTETICNDDQDNDADGLIDCEDTDCAITCDLTSNMGTYFFPTTNTSTFGSATVTWDQRVRIGNNYTIRVNYGTNYKAATVTIGNLATSKKGLPLNSGLNAPNFKLAGPNATSFETRSYSEDLPPTKGQAFISDNDHTTTTYSPFDVTIRIPTNDTMSYKDFEYIHSILKGNSQVDNIQNVFLDSYILDNVVPEIESVGTDPTIKDYMQYGTKFWIGVKATDTANPKLPSGVNGRIWRCWFNISGPGYSQAYTADDDCKRTFDNITEDGDYTVNIYPVDATGNVGATRTETYTINLVPKYVNNSFSINRTFYNTTLNQTNITAQYYTDDAATITDCNVYAQDSTGTITSLGTINATNAGDLVTCDGTITTPTTDEMYKVYVEITDAELDKTNTTTETIYVCNDLSSSGIGWSCAKADFDQDGWTEGIIENTYGVDNYCDMCLGVVNTGLDVDADGVDNACDYPHTITIPDQNWSENTNWTINLSQYFYDIDREHLNYTSTPLVNIQITIDNTTGMVYLVPDLYFNGIEYITFYAHDEEGQTATSNSVKLTVGSVNNPPYLDKNITNITWQEDTIATINLSEHFKDYDYDDLNYTSEQPENISVVIDNVTNIATLTPELNFYGTRNVVFTAYDPSGTNASSDNVTLNITPVNDEPIQVNLTSPTDDYNTTDTTPSLEWTNSTDYDPTDMLTYYLQISDDNFTTTILEQNTTTKQYELIAGQELNDGVYNWRVITCDNSSAANNCSYSTENRTIRIDTDAPTIIIDAPIAGSIVGWNISIQTTITDTVKVDSAWYEIINSSGENVFNRTLTETEGFDSYWLTNVSTPDGNYTLKVYSNDTFGHYRTTNVTFQLQNSKPQITISVPKENYYGTDFNTSITILGGMLTDSYYNITDSSGALIQNNTASSINSPTFLWNEYINVTAYIEDNYTITVYAQDNIGNNNTEQTWFVIDKTAPAYYNLTITPLIAYNNDTVTIDIVWTDSNHVSAVLIEHDANGTLTNYTTTDLGNNSYTTTISSNLFQNGETISWTIYANDSANNWNSTPTNTFTIQNRAPTTTTIPAQTWNEDNNITINLSAYFTDVDGDNLTYTSTALTNINITIDNSTGIATLTPAANWYGTDTITFTATDGIISTDSNNITLIVTNVADCGDGTCETGENSDNCVIDCPRPSGGGGGITPPTTCIEEWWCTPWSSCRPTGTRLRTCHEVGVCNEFYNIHIIEKVYKEKKPTEIENCTYTPTCDDGVQNGEETDIDCGGTCISCGTGKTCNTNEDCSNKYCYNSKCRKPTCDDGIQNQNEIRIDCGGECAPCPTCYDGICNQDESCTTDTKLPPDCGGECGGICPRPEEPTQIELIRGPTNVQKTNVTLWINETTLIKFRGDNYNLDLVEINPNNIKIMVRQTGEQVKIRLGYTNYTDLDQDKIEDLAIRLDSLSPDRAKLNITIYTPSYWMQLLLLTALFAYITYKIGRRLMLLDIAEYLITGRKKIRKEIARIRTTLTKRRTVKLEDIKKLEKINNKLEKIKKSLAEQKVKPKEQYQKELEEAEKLTRIKKLENDLIRTEQEQYYVIHPTRVRRIKDLESLIIYSKGIIETVLKTRERKERELTEHIQELTAQIKEEEKPKIKEKAPIEHAIKHRKVKITKLEQQISEIDKTLQAITKPAEITTLETKPEQKVIIKRLEKRQVTIIEGKGLKSLDKELEQIDKQLEELTKPITHEEIKKTLPKKPIIKKAAETRTYEKTREEIQLEKRISSIDEQLKKIREAPEEEARPIRKPAVKEITKKLTEIKPYEKTKDELQLDKKLSSIDEQLKKIREEKILEEEIKPIRKPAVKEAVKKLQEIKPKEKTREEKQLDKELSSIDEELKKIKQEKVSEEEIRPSIPVKKKLTLKETITRILTPKAKPKELKKLDKEITRIDEQLKKIREEKITEEEIRPVRKPITKEIIKKLQEIKPYEKTREEKQLDKKLSTIDEQLKKIKEEPITEEEPARPKKKLTLKETITRILTPPAKKHEGLKKLDKQITKIDNELKKIKQEKISEEEIRPIRKPITKEIVKKVAEIKPYEKTIEEIQLDKELSTIDEQLKKIREEKVSEEEPARPKKKLTLKETITKILAPPAKKHPGLKKLDKEIEKINQQLKQIQEPETISAEEELEKLSKQVKRRKLELLEQLKKEKKQQLEELTKKEKSKEETKLDKELSTIDEQLKKIKEEATEKEEITPTIRAIQTPQKPKKTILELIQKITRPDKKQTQKLDKKLQEIDEQLKKIKEEKPTEEKIRPAITKKPETKNKKITIFVKTSKKEIEIQQQISQIDQELRKIRQHQEEDIGIYKILQKRKNKEERR